MLYLDKISGERVQDNWSSGYFIEAMGWSTICRHNPRLSTLIIYFFWSLRHKQFCPRHFGLSLFRNDVGLDNYCYSNQIDWCIETLER